MSTDRSDAVAVAARAPSEVRVETADVAAPMWLLSAVVSP
jgi:hypothetical protein